MTDPVYLWAVKNLDDGTVTEITDLTKDQFRSLEAAAQFQPVSGRRGDDLVANESGDLSIVDTCGEVHAVDPARFVAVPSAGPARTPREHRELRMRLAIQMMTSDFFRPELILKLADEIVALSDALPIDLQMIDHDAYRDLVNRTKERLGIINQY